MTSRVPRDVQLQNALERIDDLKEDKAELRVKVSVLETENARLRSVTAATTTSHHYHPRYLDGSDTPSSRSPYRASSPAGQASVSIESLKRAAQQLREELADTQIALAEARSKTDGYRQEARLLRAQNRQLIEFAHHLKDENQRMSEAATNQGGELGVLRAQLDDALSLANTRGKELVGSQVFLNKADALSMAEIKESVEQLNHEIFQAAAFLGELITFGPTEQPSHEAWEQVRKVAIEGVGSPIADFLLEQTKQPNPKANDFVVQVVGQVMLSNLCEAVVNDWFPVNVTKSEFMKDIYTSIRAKEEPAVSGRWRSITRRHTRTATSSPEAVALWSRRLTEILRAVLQFAAWKAPTDNSKRKGFQTQVEHIFKAVVSVREAIGEGYTSSDILLVVIPPGTPFDKQTMEDVWGYGDEDLPRGGKVRKEIVVGNTGIGLKLCSASQGDGKDEIILKPKIILQSTLESAVI